MATGFEKFKNKALAEGPIQINTPKQNAATYETPAEERPKTELREPATAYERTAAHAPSYIEPVHEAPAERGRRQKREATSMLVQVSPETKAKLDEMRFRLKKKNWELVDEAVKDLYDKYFKR